MEDRFGHRISYLRVSITDRCNERCTYCMPQELQEWLPRHDILTFEETLRLIRIASDLGVTKIRLTGGEPLTRRDVIQLFRQLPRLTKLREIGLSTNGTLLTREVEPGLTMAQAVRDCGFNSVNISLDTLDRAEYARITGRDLLPEAIAGIDAAIAAGFPQIKINSVLMRGRNDHGLAALVDFAAKRNLLLRFIELMPVSTTEVLTESNFFPVAEARRALEAKFGPLIPEPEFRTNGPASYYPNCGPRPAHRIHRGDDQPAFLRELQQAPPDLRRKTAAVSRELPRVRHHAAAARRSERRRSCASSFATWSSENRSSTISARRISRGARWSRSAVRR